MNISQAQLRSSRKDFKKMLAEIKRDEMRILLSLRNEVDKRKSKQLLQSIQTDS